ncbi:uncharacterized protein DUF2058 [Archangium gephyra]|uniref:Uncharacterized protein DUF2058 n=1 Tax=Archangium gephyra TaxID=48 RepID=A0AAC8TCN8_9BACT|nr:DUF2058 family protein [Archangium gephyra]AKJ01202.1 Hypothetical protein AA314_02828 [Archangium gephyra]REG24483.1 uncharacterized protein DUF2058 [Archangium gephyra]
MQNLRDKLLKAGLVSEDQAKKAETTAPTARRPAPSQEARREGPPARQDREPREPREARGRDERPPRRDDRGGGRPPPGGGRPQGAGGRPQGGPPSRGPGGRPQGGRPQGGRPGGEPTGGIVPKLPPLPGSKAAQRMESKKQVELDRKLRELVLNGQVPVDVGATVFYFMTRKGKLRRLELTETQAKQLEEGTLGVVERPEPAQIEHSLVPAAVAEQMYAISKKSVRFLNRKDLPIGFMSDDQVKEQQEAEARGDAPVDEGGDEEAAEGEESAPAEAAAEGTPGPEGGSEPTPS